jgi:hypothetical protein
MRRRKRHMSVVEAALVAGLFLLPLGAVHAQETPPPPTDEGAPPADAETPAAEGEVAPPAEASTPPKEEEPPPGEVEAVPVEDQATDATPPAEATEAAAGEPVEAQSSESTSTETALDVNALDETDEKTTDDDEDEAPSRRHMVLKLDNGHEILFRLLFAYELHFNMISDDYSENDWFSYYLLQLSADVTKNNQLAVRMDLEQTYIADDAESGLWFGDMRFYYTRKFAIPFPDFAIPGKASLYLTAPTSRQSQARGYITKPTAVLGLAPSVGPFTLNATGYFRYSAAEYAETTQGDMNTMLTGGYALQLVFTPVDWFSPYFTWRNAWNKAYDTREGEAQPWLGNYGFEIATDFSLPIPEAGPAIDIILAYSQGSNNLEDGVYRTYFAKRDQTSIYLGINILY